MGGVQQFAEQAAAPVATWDAELVLAEAAREFRQAQWMPLRAFCIRVYAATGVPAQVVHQQVADHPDHFAVIGSLGNEMVGLTRRYAHQAAADDSGRVWFELVSRLEVAPPVTLLVPSRSGSGDLTRVRFDRVEADGAPEYWMTLHAPTPQVWDRVASGAWVPVESDSDAPEWWPLLPAPTAPTPAGLLAWRSLDASRCAARARALLVGRLDLAGGRMSLTEPEPRHGGSITARQWWALVTGTARVPAQSAVLRVEGPPPR
ncbi:hypothetical protein [Nocardioides limicola]|uniref:hypothetical protein n=1 Tax=Nocardioides limicola TaxID=2803368 RepID=UPI00193B9B59|nr:hypothetical protein [Nocardioides sp. DJM-14]